MINTKLLLERFHYLADNRHLYRNGDGSNVAFIVTVNDGTVLRESLYRPGRAIWYEHEPSVENKRNIAWRLLNPQTTAERELVDDLTRRFKHQSVAFWPSLVTEIQSAAADRAMRRGQSTTATMDAAYRIRVLADPDLVWASAMKLRKSRVKIYLNKRSLLRRIGL